jgi:hypothetical protein
MRRYDYPLVAFITLLEQHPFDNGAKLKLDDTFVQCRNTTGRYCISINRLRHNGPRSANMKCSNQSLSPLVDDDSTTLLVWTAFARPPGPHDLVGCDGGKDDATAAMAVRILFGDCLSVETSWPNNFVISSLRPRTTTTTNLAEQRI